MAASLRHLNTRLVAVAAVIGAAFMLSGCMGGSGSPSASKASTKTHAEHSDSAQAANSAAAAQEGLAAFVNAWVGARNTEEAADTTSYNAAALINADITKQNQRIQQDETTVRNQYGLNCNVSSEFSTYESCVQGDQQAASGAQSDEAEADAQIQADDQQYATESSTFGAALSTFLSEIENMAWPSSMASTESNLVSAAQAFRADYAKAAAETNGTPPSTVSEITAQTGIDAGTLSDAISAVNADLLHLGASLQTS